MQTVSVQRSLSARHQRCIEPCVYLIMRITVVTPTRGDRPLFLSKCCEMVSSQSIKPDRHIIVDDEHKVDYPDTTWRYKLGIQRAIDDGADVIFFMEDDDWYHKDYIKTYLEEWTRLGKPSVFGLDYTVYYHIIMRAYRVIPHPRRSSMMSTMITPNVNLAEIKDERDPFVDLIIWRFNQRSAKTFHKPLNKPIAIGIKHGLTTVAGGGHKKMDSLYRKGVADKNMSWLEDSVDKKMFNFYKELQSGKSNTKHTNTHK